MRGNVCQRLDEVEPRGWHSRRRRWLCLDKKKAKTKLRTDDIIRSTLALVAAKSDVGSFRMRKLDEYSATNNPTTCETNS